MWPYGSPNKTAKFMKQAKKAIALGTEPPVKVGRDGTLN